MTAKNKQQQEQQEQLQSKNNGNGGKCAAFGRDDEVWVGSENGLG
jgi:hypothetical protein